MIEIKPIQTHQIAQAKQVIADELLGMGVAKEDIVLGL